MKTGEASASALRTELIRKSIHFLIALAPSLAAIDRIFTVMLLGAGALVYAYAESVRLAGGSIPIISSLTAAAARERDRGRFVLGPITLGLGAMLALLLYPDPAASLAVYALAFGDGFAGLIGKFFGKIRPRFLMGKSLEGSAACFIAVFGIAFRMTANARTAFFAALVATMVEALPLEDFDNLALPMSVGLVTHFFEVI